jgi:transcriptional regulator with XRE-family HTH domain
MAPTIGDHIAARRRVAALTQEALAERAGISVEVIRKLEQGTKSSARVSTLRAVAQALGTTTSSLLGDASTGAARREPDHDQVALLDLRRVPTPARGLGGRPSAPDPGGTVSADLAAFRDAIGVVDRAYHDDDYATTLAALPGLLVDGRTATTTVPTCSRGVALSLLSAAYRVTGTTLIQLRSFDLAYRALDLGMDAADEAGDAARALRLAHHVPPTGRATPNNRNRFRLDVAHAQAMHGSHTAAVETLRAIRADAPVWLRQQRSAADVVSLLAAARRRTVSAELAELAGFVDARI